MACGITVGEDLVRLADVVELLEVDGHFGGVLERVELQRRLLEPSLCLAGVSAYAVDMSSSDALRFMSSTS